MRDLLLTINCARWNKIPFRDFFPLIEETDPFNLSLETFSLFFAAAFVDPHFHRVVTDSQKKMTSLKFLTKSKTFNAKHIGVMADHSLSSASPPCYLDVSVKYPLRNLLSPQPTHFFFVNVKMRPSRLYSDSCL